MVLHYVCACRGVLFRLLTVLSVSVFSMCLCVLLSNCSGVVVNTFTNPGYHPLIVF